MESIKISVEVSVNLSESTQSFIKSLFTTGLAVNGQTSQSAKPVVEPAKPAIKSVAPAAPTIEPAAPAVEPVKPAVEPAKPAKSTEPVSEPAAPAAEPAKPALSIEDVRQELVKKVNAHREEIKAKLTELGAPSVTKLDPSKYEEMYNYLTSL